MKLVLLTFLLLIIFASAAQSQTPSIGTIDFYGLRTVSEDQVREKFGFKESDAMISKAQKLEIEKRLSLLQNVVEAKIVAICCLNNQRWMIYIGIREKGTPALKFRPAPKGKIRLPGEIIKLVSDFDEASQQAVSKGDAADDFSQGHSLMKNAEARRIQEKFIPITGENLNLLRRVLRESADAESRADAAQIIAYYKDKKAIIDDLLYAVNDADSTVRNNATRALGGIAIYASQNTEKKISVSYEPFINMLNSIEWTDRNKALLVLSALTEKRDPVLMKLLRERALGSLVEMARWKNDGYSGIPFVILGRMAELPEMEIGKALMTGNRAEEIEKIRKRLAAEKAKQD